MFFMLFYKLEVLFSTGHLPEMPKPRDRCQERSRNGADW